MLSRERLAYGEGLEGGSQVIDCGSMGATSDVAESW